MPRPEMGTDRKDTPMRTVNINFHAGTRSNTKSKTRTHTLTKCAGTGLARYRDRHQARDGARALSAGSPECDVSIFACPDCAGWHVEKTVRQEPIAVEVAPDPTAAYTKSLAGRKRRYFLIDVENPTCGAKATSTEVGELWRILKEQAPGIAPHDHVVVGASRNVTRKYRAAFHGPNVKWVVGANSPDAADCALVRSIDLYRVARDYDEVVIVSGDHAFAALARQAKKCGLSVQVITVEHPTQRTMLSRELADIADTRTLIRLERRESAPISTAAQAANLYARRPVPARPMGA